MIDVRAYRAEFSVYILSTDATEAKKWGEVLLAAGYQPQVFIQEKAFFQFVEQTPPHVVLIDASRLTAFQETLNKLNEISSETLCISFHSGSQSGGQLALIQKGHLYDTLALPMQMHLELLVRVDRAIERLLAQFSGEQLDESGTDSSRLLTLDQSLDASRDAEADAETKAEVSLLKELTKKFAENKEKELLIREFLQTMSAQLDDCPAFFLRFLPGQTSLLMSQVCHLEFDAYRGLGLQMKGVSKDRLSYYLKNPNEIPQMQELIKKVFSLDKFVSLPLTVNSEERGVFVFLADAGERQKNLLHLALNILASAYWTSELWMRNHDLEIYEVDDHVYNKRYITTQIDLEVARGRRTHLPMSILLLEIDQLEELEQELGSFYFKELQKQVGKLLGRIARTNDFLGALDDGLFINVLPHTLCMGAAVKGERLRRLVEATKFKMLEGRSITRLTLSVGVSEYPTYASDSSQLIRTADEAIKMVKDAGGNKVCLAQAPRGFIPEYEPLNLRKLAKELI